MSIPKKTIKGLYKRRKEILQAIEDVAEHIQREVKRHLKHAEDWLRDTNVKASKRHRKAAQEYTRAEQMIKRAGPATKKARSAAARQMAETGKKSMQKRSPDYWRTGKRHVAPPPKDWWSFTKAEQKSFDKAIAKGKHKPLKVVDVGAKPTTTPARATTAPATGKKTYIPDYSQTGSGSKRAGFQPAGGKRKYKRKK